MTAALRFEKVSRRFGRTVAVDDVTLDVEEGEILCLLGPSGCGKSTLLRIAAGLETMDAGRVSVAGQEVAAGDRMRVPPEDRNIGFMFQDFALFPHLNVADNVAFGLGALAPAERRARVAETLARVGMAEQAHAYPHTLSGGQQQRVALARALAPRPRLFLLDEPFSGLDARLRHRLADETWRLLKEANVATVMVTHDPEEAMFLADRIALMHHGRIEQIDDPDTVYRTPISPFAAHFLSDNNRLSSVVENGVARTILGPVAARDMTDGTRVEVLIRQEGIVVVGPADGLGTPDTEGVAVRVERARPLGSQALLFLSVEGAAGGTAEKAQILHAKVPSASRPEEGSRVRVVIDAGQAFVFPAGPTK